jgi:hypothetical protein
MNGRISENYIGKDVQKSGRGEFLGTISEVFGDIED